jgi:hypothetical protein
MNDDDELRARLARLDPLHGDRDARGPVRSHDDPASRQHLEQIMAITQEPTREKKRNNNRSLTLLGAAAAIIAVAVIGVVAFNDDDSDGSDVAAVQLTAGESNVAASCVIVDATILADVQIAFRGTVETIEGNTITLAVDDWYKGGEGDTVQINVPSGVTSIYQDVEFTEGNQYLVSAYDGVVNYCGFSGAATPELQALYDAAFPG